jgi:hypothetical protein
MKIVCFQFVILGKDRAAVVGGACLFEGRLSGKGRNGGVT